MKHLLLLWLFPAIAAANSYEGTRYANTEGKVYTHLSGEFAVAASTISWSTYTIKLNGTGGEIRAQKVVVSTGAANTVVESLCLAGAHATLPTTGYARGCILYLTTDPTNLYLSTETVVGTYSWKAK